MPLDGLYCYILSHSVTLPKTGRVPATPVPFLFFLGTAYSVSAIQPQRFEVNLMLDFPDLSAERKCRRFKELHQIVLKLPTLSRITNKAA